MQPPAKGRPEALDRYLAQVTTQRLFTPEREASEARRIAHLRALYWQALLSYPPHVDAIAGTIEAAGEFGLEDELAALRASARRLRDRGTRRNREVFCAAAEAASQRLTWAEPEPTTADLVREEVERVAAGRITGARVDLHLPPARSRPFAAYVERIRRARRHYDRATREFVRANLRLVIATAKHYDFGVLPLSDLIQEGNLGLMKAVERFDPRRGTRFSTFAVWWIRHKITRAVANQGRTIRLPVHVTVAGMNLRKAGGRLERELGREPTEAELGRVLHMSEDRVGLTRRALKARPVSTAAPLQTEGASCVEDTLRDHGAQSGFDRIEAARDCERLQDAMKVLPRMERDILRRRFGLSDGEEHTLAQIGESYHLSRERIRQLQNRALKRLRRELDAA